MARSLHADILGGHTSQRRGIVSLRRLETLMHLFPPFFPLFVCTYIKSSCQFVDIYFH